MTDAPKRIWATSAVCSAGQIICYDYDAGHGADSEYHLARPCQPCSTDEFLKRVMQWWSKHPSDPSDEDLIVRLWNWHDGDFTAAMEGLK